MRISNFFALAAFLYRDVCDAKLWPDFTRKDLFAAADDFAKRQRRYGGV